MAKKLPKPKKSFQKRSKQPSILKHVRAHTGDRTPSQSIVIICVAIVLGWIFGKFFLHR